MTETTVFALTSFDCSNVAPGCEWAGQCTGDPATRRGQALWLAYAKRFDGALIVEDERVRELLKAEGYRVGLAEQVKDAKGKTSLKLSGIRLGTTSGGDGDGD